MTFNPIRQEAVASWTNKLEPLLERMALHSGGRYTPDHLYEGLASGLCWLAEIDNWRAAMVLKQVNWPTGLRELEIVSLAGAGMDEWGEAVFSAESIARDLRFNRITIPHGRKGWTKPCISHGWKEAGVILQKDLADG